MENFKSEKQIDSVKDELIKDLQKQNTEMLNVLNQINEEISKNGYLHPATTFKLNELIK